MILVDDIIQLLNSENPKVRYRVLKITLDSRFIYLFNVDEYKKSLPFVMEMKYLEAMLGNGTAFICFQDRTDNSSLPDHLISESRKKIRDSRLIYIGDFLKKFEDQLLDKETRGKRIAELEEQTGVSRKVIYEHLRLYWRGGQKKNALLGNYDKCGGKGKERNYSGVKLGRPRKNVLKGGEEAGINIDDKFRKIIRTAVRQFYLEMRSNNLRDCFKFMNRIFFRLNESDNSDLNKNDNEVPLIPESERPTFTQFKYWAIKDANWIKDTKIKKGEHFFNKKIRAVIGDSNLMAFGPGSMFQIDACIPDIFLDSSVIKGVLIGHPVIYVIIDVFSELIVGVAVTLEGPNWTGYILAIDNMLANKVDFCRDFDIEIPDDLWPVHGMKPHQILTDNAEGKSENSDYLSSEFDIDVLNTPAYRPDWKALIERLFKTIKDQIIKFVPGGIYEKRENGDPDYRLDGCLTLYEFRQILIDFIITYNNYHILSDYRRDLFMISDEVPMIPIELWKWGITNRTGLLRREEHQLARPKLLPKGKAMVTSDGLKFKGIYYTCQRAEEENWFEKVRSGKEESWPETVSYDTRVPGKISLLKDSKVYPCKLMEKDKRFESLDLYEIEDLQEREKDMVEKLQTSEERAMAGLQERMEMVANNAVDRAQEERAGMSNAAVVRNMRENRAAERDKEREESAGNFNPTGRPSDNSPRPSVQQNRVPGPHPRLIRPYNPILELSNQFQKNDQLEEHDAK